MILKTRILAVALAVAVLTSPSRAAEIDPYLPANTEFYYVLNIRQILNSELIKKVGVDNIRALMNQREDIAAVLKDLGLDPLKDIDKIIATGPGEGKDDEGLAIIRGRFDIEKFKARAAKESKDQKDVIKPVKIAGQDCYEIVIADAGQSVFVGFASKNAILAAASKDYLGDALKVKDGTKATLKNKAFQEMIEKLDDRQSMATVVNSSVLTRGGQLNDLPAAVKEPLGKLTAISGGITLTDGIKFEVTGGTKTANDAQELKDLISNGINAAIGLAALAAMQQKELAPVIDFLKSVKTTSRDKSVTLKAEITGEELGKLIPRP